jgi:hypothetical protein
MYGRPRSHTAPSTPRAEVACQEPVELLGSLPNDQVADVSPRHSSDSKTTPRSASRTRDGFAKPLQAHSQDAVHQYQESPQYVRTPASAQPHQPPFSPESIRRVKSHRTCGPQTSQDEDTLVGDAEPMWMSGMRRSSMSVLQSWQPRPSISLAPAHTSRNNRLLSVPQASWPIDDSSPQASEPTQSETESVLMEQVAAMRISHEAHLNGIRQAHGHEIAAQRSYIAFLEQRNSVLRRSEAHPSRTQSRHVLAIDTDRAARGFTEHPLSDASASTQQSTELISHKSSSHGPAAETESLKRKLSLLRRSQSDTGEVIRERDQYRDSIERSDRRILQLKDIVRKAKENEKTLRNAVDDLQTRLLAANNERLDIREGFHEACQHVRRLVQELHGLRKRVRYTTASSTSLASTQSDRTHDRSHHEHVDSEMNSQMWKHDPLLAQVRQMQQRDTEKDARIKQLEHQLHCARESQQAAEPNTSSLQTHADAGRVFPPDGSSTSSITRQSGGEQDTRNMSSTRHCAGSSGLGIRLTQPPKTPERFIISATRDALATATTSAHEPFTSPRPHSKTPLSTHKKLPKPPVSRSPSPMVMYSPPPCRVRLQDTPRSLSESIISSYAKRSMYEQDVVSLPSGSSMPILA